MVGCILIHGFTGSELDLRSLSKVMRSSTDWQIEQPILHGHGHRLNLEEACAEDWLNQLKDTFDRLANTCQTIYVVGFSLGSLLALKLAESRNVDKVILLAPAFRILPAKQTFVGLAEVAWQLVSGTFKKTVFYEQVSGKIKKVPLRMYPEITKLQHWTNESAHKLSMPLVVIQGLDDWIVSVAEAKAFVRKSKATYKRCMLVADSGHFLCLDRDHIIVNQLIMKELKKSHSSI